LSFAVQALQPGPIFSVPFRVKYSGRNAALAASSVGAWPQLSRLVARDGRLAGRSPSGGPADAIPVPRPARPVTNFKVRPPSKRRSARPAKCVRCTAITGNSLPTRDPGVRPVSGKVPAAWFRGFYPLSEGGAEIGQALRAALWRAILSRRLSCVGIRTGASSTNRVRTPSSWERIVRAFSSSCRRSASGSPVRRRPTRSR
jgi:hypothetical protein